MLIFALGQLCQGGSVATESFATKILGEAFHISTRNGEKIGGLRI